MSPYTIIIHYHANNMENSVLSLAVSWDCVFSSLSRVGRQILISNINIWMQSIKVNHAKDIKAK